jgi:hypothetical protein
MGSTERYEGSGSGLINASLDLLELLDGFLPPESSEESLDVHNVRMAMRDLRAEVKS